MSGTSGGHGALTAEQGGHLLSSPDGVGLVVGDDVHHAGSSAVSVGAAQPQHVDVLAGDRADHVRTGDEDPPIRSQDHDVGQGRSVRRAAGSETQHDRDLRDLARGLGHGVEDPADRMQRQHALGEPSATGVPDPDDRHPVPASTLVRLHHDPQP